LERRFRVFRRQRRPNTGNEILASQHFGDYSMKRTQIALAAVALVASTAAMAEVKISGTIDAGVASNSTRNVAGVRAGTNFSGAGGFVAGNNINFSGSEDLGGGLKAGFTLGAGFDAGNGSSGNGGSAAMFTQQANVSLGGDAGTVKLGMQLSPFISASPARVCLVMATSS